MVPDLGAFLVERGVITREQLQKARLVQQTTRQIELARVLVDLGFVTAAVAVQARAALISALRVEAAKLGLAFVNLDHFGVDAAAVSALPAPIARRHRVIPVMMTNGVLTVATSGPGEPFAEFDVSEACDQQVTWVVAAPDAIDAAIARCYAPP